jgi:hypothetical protein
MPYLSHYNVTRNAQGQLRIINFSRSVRDHKCLGHEGCKELGEIRLNSLQLSKHLLSLIFFFFLFSISFLGLRCWLTGVTDILLNSWYPYTRPAQRRPSSFLRLVKNTTFRSSLIPLLTAFSFDVRSLCSPSVFRCLSSPASFSQTNTTFLFDFY